MDVSIKEDTLVSFKVLYSSSQQVFRNTENSLSNIIFLQGATIVNDNEEILIGRIIKGGMAEKTGLLHEGDRILEINGMDVTGKSIDELSDMLVSTLLRMTCIAS